MSILMCRPDYFGIEYEINPWMHLDVQVDHAQAVSQWEALHRTYTDLGEEVELTAPVKGLPDMVFTANAALVWKGKAVLSRFRHPQRQGEQRYWGPALEQCGLELLELPPESHFEGAGDGLFVGSTLFCGYGFRTQEDVPQIVAGLLDVEVVPLQLVDPHFYHLDTCFCPLTEDAVLFAPQAFTEESAEAIRRRLPHAIEVPAQIAAGFACNSLVIGDTVVGSSALPELQTQLADCGLRAMGLPMTEFMKSGGAVRCLSLPLQMEP